MSDPARPAASLNAPARTLAYRPHLDGLRAVAVVAVFVFHAAPSVLPGGFIGVDVFFVLSGYLITSILIRHCESPGGGILTSFYARRVRRLLPASLLLLAVVAVHQAVWGDLLDLGLRRREIRATVLYVANWNLIGQSDDYFAESATASPLRHMWSLAVEEQFYFVWPLILVAALVWRRWNRERVAVLAAALIAASVLAMVTRYDPASVSRAYFGTDTRVFQPMIGALLALAPLGLRAHRRRVVGSALAILGIVSLMALTVTMSGESSWYFHGGAVLVAIAAASVILGAESAPNGPAARMLSWSPFVLLGQISYGFYLWHWPIILWIQPPDGADFIDRRLVNLAQFALALAVSIASYVIVERPIREWNVGFRPTVAAGLATMLIVFALAGVLVKAPTGNLVEAATADRSFEPCPADPRPCIKLDQLSSGAPTVALVGDSTAQSYDPALKRLAAENGFRYVQAAVGGCSISHRLLATGIDGELHKPSNFMCHDQIPSIYDEVLERWDPALIIATSWNETNQHVTNGETVASGTPRHLAETSTALAAAVDRLTSGGALLVFLEVLPPGPSVDCLAVDEENAGTCIRQVAEPRREAPYNQMFADLAAERDDVSYIEMSDVICPEGTCPLTIDGVVVRYDGTHFTATESVRLAPLLGRRLAAAGVDVGEL